MNAKATVAFVTSIVIICLSSCSFKCHTHADEVTRGLDGRIYLRMSCITEWNSCHAYSIDAYTD